jgi:hypothetical protein
MTYFYKIKKWKGGGIYEGEISINSFKSSASFLLRQEKEYY